jgi:alkylation response protein AidB-like acyl-CoA dehydrogenase
MRRLRPRPKTIQSTIADFQHTQFQMADMLTELVAARQMIRVGRE